MTIKPSSLAEPFADAPQQRRSAVLGMWIFLATEVLFFGGPLFLYGAYRYGYGNRFLAGSPHLDIVLGTVNTAVLLLSSLLMVYAIEQTRAGRAKEVFLLLVAVAGLGTVFLGIKAYEWHAVFEDGFWPGAGFSGDGPLRLFFTLYFVLTGLHALHLSIGIATVLLFAAAARWSRPFRPTPNQLVLLGLYWHFIDIVWVFLFPLLYLAHRHL